MKKIWSTFFPGQMRVNFEVCFTSEVILCYLLKFCDVLLTLSTQFKQEVKNAIVKYLSDYNKEIFQYYNFIKNKKEYWKSFSTPLEYMKNEFEEVNYIKDFFSELIYKCDNGEKNKVKSLTSDEFCKGLNKNIEKMSDLFFGLNIDEEW